MKAKQRNLFMQLTLLALALFASNIQASRLVEGSLGSWIGQQASPKLGEILARHPRFKGEPIKITATRDGHPLAITDQLTDLIREQLIEDLLSLADVKIVFDEPNRCNPIRVNIVLGIEVQTHGAREHRVSLVMVDIEEGIWLSGTNIFWHGRLSSAQRRAFDSRLPHRPTPAVFNARQTPEIAQALYTQMQCNNAIATPIFFEPAESDADGNLLRRLIEKISNQRLVTMDKEAAASVISLRYAQGEFSLDLAASGFPDRSQRIAQVRVTGTTTATTSAFEPGELHKTRAHILSAIQVAGHHAKNNVCDRRKEHCIDISFELYQSAYTVIFYTANGQVAPLSCELPTRQRPGRLHYGINVPAADSSLRPSVGFYALAFKERSAASALHRALKKNAPKCGGRRLPQENWVASFAHLLHPPPDRSDWRAIHLTRDHTRTTRL